MVALISSYTFALVVPFCHRFGKRFLRRSLAFSAVFTGVMMVVFALRSPFDAMHPKRLYILHSENVSKFSLLIESAIILTRYVDLDRLDHN